MHYQVCPWCCSTSSLVDAIEYACSNGIAHLGPLLLVSLRCSPSLDFHPPPLTKMERENEAGSRTAQIAATAFSISGAISEPMSTSCQKHKFFPSSSEATHRRLSFPSESQKCSSVNSVLRLSTLRSLLTKSSHSTNMKVTTVLPFAAAATLVGAEPLPCKHNSPMRNPSPPPPACVCSI